jgi:hypothetical protein
MSVGERIRLFTSTMRKIGYLEHNLGSQWRRSTVQEIKFYETLQRRANGNVATTRTYDKDITAFALVPVMTRALADVAIHPLQSLTAWLFFTTRKIDIAATAK